ncbi:AbrB family transcriptional regulator [Erysipelothrix inopinata]|uniref:AbrB family transcriptional regulator n=1 Tax=Erysipelothrix inopinata TaxID=225084 RepID=UPI0024841814|nr:AbrB family transcriptional regulator [Erysipelothrix inopinata]
MLFVGAIAIGYILKKLKVPGGMMLGSLIFSVIYINYQESPVTFNLDLSLVSQVLAGVCIGAKITMNDVKNIKNLYKEIIMINIGLLVISITSGLLLFYVFKLSPYDSFFGSIPGGMTSIPIIAMEYGANPVNVTILQFVRLIVGIGIFPRLISKQLNLSVKKEQDSSYEKMNKLSTKDAWLQSIFTILTTLVLVAFLEYLKFPLGTLVLAIVISALYNIITSKAYIRDEIYSLAQLLLGMYIGSVVDMKGVASFSSLVLPLLSAACIFGFGSYFLGKLIKKYTDFNTTEAYFSAIPAGAADVGLITQELGVFSSKIVVVQVARVLIVTLLFPPIMDFVIHLLT